MGLGKDFPSGPAKKITIMEFRIKTVMTIAALATMISSCTKDPSPEVPGESTRITAKLASYGEAASSVAGENTITDMKGFLFQDGVMTRIYDFEVSHSNEYTFNVDSRKGNLYLVAYSASEIPTEGILEKGISEADWKNSVADITSTPSHFFTGLVALEDTSYPNTADVSLKRGLARFDLKLNTIDPTTVKSITISNLATSVYLFPSESVKSPADPKRNDNTVTFPEPLAVDTDAVMYVGEQVNESIQITVTAMINGTEKTMTKAFSGDIKRNTVYTITVLQNSIDITFDVTFDEWESGTDTELTPVLI